jgi:predicted  nucleic acid-binding Zn-ribbon protein
MNVKILRDKDSDQSVARKVSSMMLNNYKRGLAVANEEIAPDSSIADGVTTINPNDTIKIKKQPDMRITGPAISKHYKIKSNTTADISKPSTSSSQVKEFMLQSKALDNELDHVVAQLKFNNKNQFYDTAKSGDVKDDLYDKIHKGATKAVKNYEKTHPINEQIKQLQKELKKATTKHNNTTKKNQGVEDEAGKEALQAMQDHINALGLQRDALVAEMVADIPTEKEVIPRLADQGKTIDRTRDKRKTTFNTFTDMDKATYNSTVSDSNRDIRSRNGVRMVDTIDVESFSQDLLLEIKKISNIITVTLMPLAQKMYSTKFAGVDIQDRTVTIPTLYTDMADKLYILTSLNNQHNAQLVKLDKEFDKLYNLVDKALAMYVDATGGAIPTFRPNDSKDHIRHTTIYPYEL